MRAEIIAVGSELLTPARVETNSLFMTAQLNFLGIEVYRKFVVGDRAKEIRESLSDALKNSDVVVITGGLGPTHDDLTREVVAEFFGRSLHEDEKILEELARRYERFRFKMTENNRKQAMVPEGARILPNPNGTAPGLLLVEGGVLVFLLPGPPRELEPMVRDHVLPLIREHKQVKTTRSRILKVASEAESRVDARIGSIYLEYSDIETTILSSPGIITLTFSWKGEDVSSRAEERLDELTGRIEKELGASVYSRRDETLPEVLGRLLEQQSLSLATAESCTGGWIAKLMTDVPGSSGYFLGGIVCYANSVKREVLGIGDEILRKDGAVSSRAAKGMAEEIRRLLGADIGLAVTGIAGPGGGTKAKPVGTVFLGLSREGATRSRRLLLPGNREAIRLRTSQMALDCVRREIS